VPPCSEPGRSYRSLPGASTAPSLCVRLQRCPSNLGVSGVVGVSTTDISAPPLGELFSETFDNSVAIVQTHGTACVLLAGDAESKNHAFHLPRRKNTGDKVFEIRSVAYSLGG
jgi:hypothetical protein